MKETTSESDDAKNYQEYENFGDDEDEARRNGEGSVTYGALNHQNHNYQRYDASPHSGGNYNDPRTSYDRRDQNPYQSTYNNDNNNLRNNFYGSRGFNDGRRNSSNDSNLKHERDRGCILQCFFQELKMVK